jgi:hypothetical protein
MKHNALVAGAPCHHPRQSERLWFMSPIKYALLPDRYRRQQLRTALCLNVGAEGMLLLLDKPVRQNDVLELCVRDLNSGGTRTAVSIRWTRPCRSWLKDSVLAGVSYLSL